MQEEEKKIEPMVDIETSGPGADVELPEEKPEAEVETKEDSSSTPQAEEPREEKAEGSDAQPEAKQEEKPEEKKEELETYSKDVQRRIAKLTRSGEKHRGKLMKLYLLLKIKKSKKRNFKRNTLKLNRSVLKTEKRKSNLV